MEKKIVVARITVKEGCVEAYQELVKPLIEHTGAEPGNLVYALYQCPDDAKEFLFYEEYTDQAAFDAHGDSDYFKAFAEGVKPLLAKALDIQLF